MPDEQYDIFISYSRADYYARETVWRRLNDAGLKVWVDQRKIRFGDAWRKAIENALKHSQCVVYLASPDSNVSKWAQEELALAQKLRLPIFPVLVRGEEFPFGLNQLQYLDATSGISKTAGSEFVSTIQNAIRQGAVTTPSPPPSAVAARPAAEPLPSELMIVLLRVLEAAVDLASTQSNIARASLLWIDENAQELFIAAAIHRYQDAELRLRLGKGVGVAGEVWAQNSKEVRIAYPRRDLTEGAMRQRWNFKNDQINLLKRMGTIISVPVMRGSQMVGILSIDTPGELTEADLQAKNVIEEASEMGVAIANMPIETPFPYHKYRSMHSLIRAARLIPPYHEPTRAAIFWAADDDLYMIAGSEEYSGRWNLCDQHFRKNQGIIGHAWATGKILSDSRSAKTHKQIKEDWNLTDDQFQLARDVKSIIAAPIFVDGDEVIAVLVIACVAPMSVSRLDDYRVTVNELAQLAAKVLASP
jgi:transcriptional regulator with GAF, ATPase, and Fis domain